MNASILQPYMDKARKFFGEDIPIDVALRLELSEVGGVMEMGAEKYSCRITVGGCYFWGETLEDAMENAQKDFVPADKDRRMAAKKLAKLAADVLNGTAEIPTNI